MKTLFAEAVLENGSVQKIPYWEIESGVDGPVLLATACQHGNELNGSIAVRNFIRAVDGRLLKGKVIGVPFANPLALKARRPHLDLGPEQPYIDSAHNMQMLWPGKADGNDTERLAFALWNAVVTKATHIIDIHCYPHFAAPLIQIHRSPETESLAQVMGFSFLRYIPQGDDWEGSIRSQGVKQGKVVIGCELTGQYGVWEKEYTLGTRALLNVASYLGITGGEMGEKVSPPVLLEKCYELKSERSGLFVKTELPLGFFVHKGEEIGYILDADTLESHYIVSPCDGHIIRFSSRPSCDVSLKEGHQFVNPGDMLAVIAQK